MTVIITSYRNKGVSLWRTPLFYISTLYRANACIFVYRNEWIPWHADSSCV